LTYPIFQSASGVTLERDRFNSWGSFQKPLYRSDLSGFGKQTFPPKKRTNDVFYYSRMEMSRKATAPIWRLEDVFGVVLTVIIK
jgi:hypothetical protein